MIVEELRKAVADGPVDTVLLAIADMDGRLQGKRLAAEAFGGEVVEHYLNRARVEVAAFESAVTDWERYRGFERL